MRFVVLAVPRSGSNMLCAMLGGHPAVLCHHELFNPQGPRYALDLRHTGFSIEPLGRPDVDPSDALAAIWRCSLGHPCVGFKMTYRQHAAVFAAVLGDPAVVKVVLRRTNLLRTYVSQQIAERLGQWEVYDQRSLLAERPRVRVDPAALRERAACDEAYYQDIAGACARPGQRSVTVAYERLHLPEEQNRVLALLGVTPTIAGLPARSVRQNGADLSALIENYDELCAALRDGPFKHHLLDSAE